MDKFKHRLKELMEENSISAKDLQNMLKLKYSSLIYFWLDGTYYPKLSNLVKLADIFNCSIDYLVSKTDNLEHKKKKVSIPKFNIRLKQLFDKNKITQYKLKNEKIATSGLFRSIFKKGSDPTIETLIKLSNYLNISIDELVGRE